MIYKELLLLLCKAFPQRYSYVTESTETGMHIHPGTNLFPRLQTQHFLQFHLLIITIPITENSTSVHMFFNRSFYPDVR